jgi:hypothetical protein
MKHREIHGTKVYGTDPYVPPMPVPLVTQVGKSGTVTGYTPSCCGASTIGYVLLMNFSCDYGGFWMFITAFSDTMNLPICRNIV